MALNSRQESAGARPDVPGRLLSSRRAIPGPRLNFWVRRGCLALILLAGLLAVNCFYLNTLQARERLFLSTDFAHTGWLPGRILLAGGNPYDALAWLRTHWTPEYDREIGTAYVNGELTWPSLPVRPGQVYNPQHVAEYLYPLWVGFAFIPFAALPIYWALALFMLLSEVAIGLGLWCACKILGLGTPWYALTLFCFLAAGYRPTFWVLFEGAFDGVAFGGLLLAILLIQRRGSPALVGALLVLATVKFQVTLAILLFVGLWLLAGRRWPEIRWAVGWGAALWGIPTLLWPGWIPAWLHMTSLVSPAILAQPTIWSLCVSLFGPAWFLAGAALSVGAGAALVWYWRRDLATQRWSTLPVTFLVAGPLAYYAWEYDQLFLLVPWLACWARAAVGEHASARLWRFGLMAWVLILPLHAFLPFPRDAQPTWGLILPVTLALLYWLAGRTGRRAARVETEAVPLPEAAPGRQPLPSPR